MTAFVSNPAPAFTADAYDNGNFRQISLSEFKGRKVVLFFYPLGLFIINKDGVLKHATINHLDLGRNINEVLRVLDAVDYTEEHGEVCPANWQKGEKAMKPDSDSLKQYMKSR